MLRKIRAVSAALLIGAASLFAAVPAMADVPTGVTTVFTTAATDFATVVALGWTLFLAVRGGMIVFAIVRRVLPKAV